MHKILYTFSSNIGKYYLNHCHSNQENISLIITTTVLIIFFYTVELKSFGLNGDWEDPESGKIWIIEARKKLCINLKLDYL